MRTRVMVVALMLGVVGGLVAPLTGGGADARARRTFKATCILDPLAGSGSAVLVANPGSKPVNVRFTGFDDDGTLIVGDPFDTTVPAKGNIRLPYAFDTGLVFVTAKSKLLVDAYSLYDPTTLRQVRCT